MAFVAGPQTLQYFMQPVSGCALSSPVQHLTTFVPKEGGCTMPTLGFSGSSLPVNLAVPQSQPLQVEQFQQIQHLQQFHQFQPLQQPVAPVSLQQVPVQPASQAQPAKPAGRQQHQRQRQQSAKLSSQPSASLLPLADVIAAMEGLYRDQLKPYGRILRKRIGELFEASGRAEPSLDVKELKVFCSKQRSLDVQDEGSDWFAVIVGAPQDFIDVYSPEDLYPETFWQEFAGYFSSMSRSAKELPGGRYACAQVLVQRKLPFLDGYSLGQVCHIVQLAISHRKILGYSNGMLVPYSRSQSMVKDKRAQMQQPCTDSGVEKPVATWERVRTCVEVLVNEALAGGAPMPLSSIKRCFLTRFHTELSETALGYAKVSELLQDPRLSDTCRVELRAHGYVLLPAVSAVRPRSSISLAECLGDGAPAQQGSEGDRDDHMSALRQRAGLIKPLSLEEIDAPAASSQGAMPGAGKSDVAGPTVAAGTPATVECTPTLLFPATPSPWSPLGSTETLPTLLGRTRYLTPRSLLGSKSVSGVAGPTALSLDTLEEECQPPPDHSPNVDWTANQEPMFLPPPTPTTMGMTSPSLSQKPVRRGRLHHFVSLRTGRRPKT